jgi:hypothetical protein
MNTLKKIIMSVICLVLADMLSAQALKIGFGIAPQVSWLSSNDASVKTAGAQLGFGMGINSEYELKNRWKIVSGASLALNQGGRLHYFTGGNIWPNSELKSPLLNSGPKPIPDHSALDYDLKYWTISLGLKRTISDKEDTKVFIEIPKFNFSKIFSARGAILNDELLTTDENVINELNSSQLGLSAAIGIEKRIGRSAFWYTSAEFLRSMQDLTRNNGYKSIRTSEGDPADPFDDKYQIFKEKSKVSLNVLSIRLGVLF